MAYWYVLPANVKSSVTLLGLGYVGSVSAACLAQLGHRVYGVDKDEIKINSIVQGRAPFYEPGLEELLVANVAAGRLSVSTEAGQALAESEIALVCVGTPSDRNGNLQTEQLRRVFEDIRRHAAGRSAPLVVAIRSTVFPGTTEEIRAAALAECPHVSIVCNPEFLREGTAVRDFMEPSLLVVGGPEGPARQVAELYAGLRAEPCLVSLRTAEMIKYCCNAFHALKIAFANEVGALAEQVEVSPEEVMDVLCRDVRLNISPAYLKPGFAFGGSCLPKDLRALSYRALRLHLGLPLLESILPSNEKHLARAISAVLDMPAQRIGIFGLAFKENTDDLRESPIIAAIEHWIGKGREVRIFDPHIRLDRIYGSNRNFVTAVLPHIGRLMSETLAEVLGWCDCVVLAQKPAGAEAAAVRACGKPLVDLARSGMAAAAGAL